MKQYFYFFIALAVSLANAQPKAKADSIKLKVQKLHDEALKDPFDEDKFKAYKLTLPKVDNYFVVEGDLLLSEQELRGYLFSRAQAEKPADVTPELLVNYHNGGPDYYRSINKRNLTYAVDRNSFPDEQQYKTVVTNMELAGGDWRKACLDCKVQFTHLSQYDSAPAHERVNFIVRYYDVKGQYLAAAFFPNYPNPRRYLNIDPSYFTTTYNKVGVLRHELGHVLGYRHEHTRGVHGCYYEDDQWLPLTSYDPQSVMHYFCGEGGNLELKITPLDKKGHRKLYRITQ